MTATLGALVAIGSLLLAGGIVGYMLGRIHGEDRAYESCHRLWAVSEAGRRTPPERSWS